MSLSPSRQSGLAENIEATRLFIDDDPTRIVVTPQRGTRVRKPGGGFDTVPAAPRAARDVKLISTGGDFDGIATNETTYSETVRKFSYVLVDMPDSPLEIGDEWRDGENTYRITAKLVDNGYERKFAVVSFGPEPNYG